MRSSQSPVIATGDSLVESAAIRKPDLSALPRVFILATHLSEAELHQAEDSLVDRGASLTYDIKEANLVLGNISTERRARIELKWGKVKTEEFSPEQKHTGSALLNDSKIESHAPKRQRLNGKGRFFVAKPSEPSEPNKKNDGTTTSTTDSTTDSTLDDDKKSDTAQLVSQNPIQGVSSSPTICSLNSDEVEEAISLKSDFDSSSLKIKVLKITWLYDTIHAEEIQPFEPYTIYEAALVRSDGGVTSPIQDKLQSETTSIKKTNRSSLQEQEAQQIIERAKLDAKAVVRPKFSRTRKRDHVKEAADQDFKGRSFASSTKTEDQRFGRTVSQPPRLLHQTTSEHDEDFGSSTPPKLPDWVKEKRLYSCERATPPNSPNNEFIAQLEQIRLARTLTGDDTGVRAYSTSIASLAAYPYPLSSKREILALPGCEQKIAALFHEWRTSGKLQAVSDIDADPILQVLRVFYEIWGVGATLAREFYYDRHWRDLDDVIEQGWRSLTRVQQIGVKFYDEFQLKIPRQEVESIAATIASHARHLTDAKLECIIVGGYRRGKTESGDADIILSHPSESTTQNLISAVVTALEDAGCITHTLTLALTNSKRDQQPLPLRSLHSPAGHGFDTLDKALVVWQDQDWPSRAADVAADSHAKNPNPHRRVDIIVSPWRTVGCAVAGWTSGTTFQRDLRRYAKKKKGWKFDSSGVRERGSGRWVDLEGWGDEETRCTDWREAERRVFEGLGLEYREPWERCTG